MVYDGQLTQAELRLVTAAVAKGDAELLACIRALNRGYTSARSVVAIKARDRARGLNCVKAP